MSELFKNKEATPAELELEKWGEPVFNIILREGALGLKSRCLKLKNKYTEEDRQNVPSSSPYFTPKAWVFFIPSTSEI